MLFRSQLRNERLGVPGLSNEIKNQINAEFAGLIGEAVKAKKAEEASKAALPVAEVTSLAVSSLQAIGAGDIASINLGTYQDQMLDAQTRTASATEQVAKNTEPTNKQTSEPAKLGH